MKKTKNNPNTIVEAYNYLVKFLGTQNQPGQNFMDNNEAMNSTNIGEDEKKDISHITCFNCW